MKPERWERVYDVFCQALDVERDEREGLIKKSCAKDRGLQNEVLELLAGHEGADTEDFLGAPPWVVDEIPISLPDFADYERIEYVGHGGMGVVYKAFQRSLDRWVALKMALPHWLGTDDRLRRFRAEAESMAKLRHANIVRVHEVGEVEGRPYFSMDLIEGRSLARELNRFRDDPRSVAELLETVARAMDHAHRRGLLHRDLKPANILVDEDGQPHVTDFGLVRRVDDPTDTREVIGTAGYMSPEQADPERVETVQSDVYGLAATLYALLTGRAPEPRSPLDPSIDRDLGAICFKGLSQKPSERHASAEAFGADLRSWLDGRQTSARPWSRTERWRGRARRNPMLTWISVAMLALLALSTVFVIRELDEIAGEPALAQQALARQQANVIRLRLMQLVGAVDAAAAKPALAASMVERDLDELQRVVMKLGDQTTDLDGKSPFESWFVVDLDGHIVARWPKRLTGHRDVVFRDRDYFKGAMAHGSEHDGARSYISGVYLGQSDTRYKFGIARALLNDRSPVGVLVASVTTSPALGLPTTTDSSSKTALIARVDLSSAEEYVLLMHPSYRRGDEPVPIHGPLAVGTGIDERYADPAAAIEPSLGGTWLAGFASVESTEFVVVSQRRYEAVNAVKLWGIVITLGVLLLMLLLRLSRQ
jgi:serine/threonine protein kinase